MDTKSNRHTAAKLARQFLEKQIDFNQLMEEYPKNTADKDIDYLLNLIVEFPNLTKNDLIDKKSLKKLILNVIVYLEK